MKRIMILLLTLALCISLFAACSEEKADKDNTSSKTESATDTSGEKSETPPGENSDETSSNPSVDDLSESPDDSVDTPSIPDGFDTSDVPSESTTPDEPDTPDITDEPDESDTPDEPSMPDTPDQPSSVIDKSKVIYFTGEYSEIVENGEIATLFERASYSLLEYIDENDPDSETYFFVALKFNRNEDAESPIYSEHAVENVLEMGFISETCKLPLFTLGGQSPHLCGYATADMLNSLENEIGHITYVVWLPDPEDSETWDGYPELIRDIKYSDGRTLEEYLKENTSSREYFFVGLKCGEKDVYKYDLISCNFVYETDEEILEEYKGEYDIVGYIYSNFYKSIKSRFGVEIIWLPEE